MRTPGSVGGQISCGSGRVTARFRWRGALRKAKLAGGVFWLPGGAISVVQSNGNLSGGFCGNPVLRGARIVRPSPVSSKPRGQRSSADKSGVNDSTGRAHCRGGRCLSSSPINLAKYRRSADRLGASLELGLMSFRVHRDPAAGFQARQFAHWRLQRGPAKRFGAPVRSCLRLGRGGWSFPGGACAGAFSRPRGPVQCR